MADKVGTFIRCFNSFSDDVKIDTLKKLKPQPSKTVSLQNTPKVSREARSLEAVVDGQNIYKNIDFYSRESYFYYYPTIHWNLDATPTSDDFWVGIFNRKDRDDEYITYQNLGRTAQGSYYCGRLNTTAYKSGMIRDEEFDLRIFKGSSRLNCETNILRGKVIRAPSNPFPLSELTEPEIQPEPIDVEKTEFIRAMHEATVSNEASKASSAEDVLQQWKTFTDHQKQLLFPVLKQECLPDEIKKPAPKACDVPEPKIRFSDLGKKRELRAAEDYSIGTLGEIVLTITIDEAYTYIYPTVNVKQAIDSKNPWIGVYRTGKDLNFDPDSYLDDQWQWVGTGQEGSTKLKEIVEHRKGPINEQYLGVIFDWDVGSDSDKRIGFAENTIAAFISTTSTKPPPDFKPDFDKEQALRYAHLSDLAYQPYDIVTDKLKDYGLQAEMRIYDQSTYTNGFVASDENTIVVAFRGTVPTSPKNILTDLWFFKSQIVSGEPELGHKGFVDALNKVYFSIEATLRPFAGKKKLVITGHSLGGALATLLGYRIALDHPDFQPTQYVYGCPPVGDKSLANFFRGKDSNTITIQNDLVSDGKLILLGEWAELYKPVQVMFLPKPGGHSLSYYIEQLEQLSNE